MQSNIVLALAEYDGHIWIGTDGKGIAVLNPENNQMDVLTHIPGDAYSLPQQFYFVFLCRSGKWDLGWQRTQWNVQY